MMVIIFQFKVKHVDQLTYLFKDPPHLPTVHIDNYHFYSSSAGNSSPCRTASPLFLITELSHRCKTQADGGTKTGKTYIQFEEHCDSVLTQLYREEIK